jgi:hypothetical protein
MTGRPGVSEKMASKTGANSNRIVSIPASGGEAGLNRYLTEIK